MARRQISVAPISPQWVRQDRLPSCQLVALANAMVCYGMDPPRPGGALWEALVDRVGCRHGAAMKIAQGADDVGLLCRRARTTSLYAVRRHLSAGVPVMITLNSTRRWTLEGVHHPILGFHAVLVVAAEANRIRVINLLPGRAEDCWIDWPPHPGQLQRKDGKSFWLQGPHQGREYRGLVVWTRKNQTKTFRPRS